MPVRMNCILRCPFRPGVELRLLEMLAHNDGIAPVIRRRIYEHGQEYYERD